MQEIKSPESKGRTKAHPLSFWEEAVREYEAAGLSVRDFCELKDVGPSTFMKWKSVVEHNRGRAPQFIPVHLKEIPSFDGSLEQKSAFPPTRVNNSISNEWVLRFGEKLSLNIPQNFDAEVLKRLLSVLIPCS
jgi:hypothetical protein